MHMHVPGKPASRLRPGCLSQEASPAEQAENQPEPKAASLGIVSGGVHKIPGNNRVLNAMRIRLL